MKSGYRNWVQLLLLLSFGLLLMGLWLPSQYVLSQTPMLRIGFMGDSTIDEYRGSDNRGGSFANVTYNWMEQLVRRRFVYSGVFQNWPEPRRLGYEYNWARSASTAQSLLDEGQPQGLAAQVAAGEIDVVVMAVGDQDFAPYNANGYAPIYNGTLTDAQVTAKVNGIIANYTTAVDTVLNARTPHVPMVVTTIADFNLSPQVLTNPQFSDPVKRQRVEDALTATNDGIKAMAAERGLPVFDAPAFSLNLAALAPTGLLTLDSVTIDLTRDGDNPHDGTLSDHIHAGTVLEGMIANEYIRLINTLIDPDIPLLSNQEILGIAGLAPLPPTPTPIPPPTNTPTPPPTPTNTPTPNPPNAAPPLNYYTTLPITLTWNMVSGVIGYQVQVATSSRFDGTLIVDTTTDPATLYVNVSPVTNGVYYWRVRGQISDVAWGAWSAAQSFTVAA